MKKINKYNDMIIDFFFVLISFQFIHQRSNKQKPDRKIGLFE